MMYQQIKTIKGLEQIYPDHLLEKFPVVGKGNMGGISDSDWYDWQWQLANSAQSLDRLAELINLSELEEEAVRANKGKFAMRVNPYYSRLMGAVGEADPIRRQAIPSSDELTVLDSDLEDPLNEEEQMPVPGVTHRYPDRVLFYVSHVCPMLCRHCTRKRKVADGTSAASQGQLERGIGYIKNHPEIRDVIVSGGDPLCLSNERIEFILSRLRAIPHVEMIRIGTRCPVTMPFRLLDDELLEIFNKYQPIHINTHFNHPREMTRESLLATTRLALAGVTMANQSVLLKGVNDDVKVMTELCQKLLLMRVRPYYIFQCDLAQGISHFRTTVQEGIEIINGMRGWTSGLAIPQLVVDSPGGGGKIPMNPQYLLRQDGKEVVMRNYKNEEYIYHEP